MKKIKIAISGKANSGKNTFAEMLDLALFNKYALNFNNLAFADPIKEIAKLMFPQITNNQLYGSSSSRSSLVEGEKISVRDLLINIGENFKHINENIWIDNLHRRTNLHDNIIITDLRFLPEYEYVVRNEYFKVRILRNTDKINSSTETAQDALSNDKFDLVIDNNGTLEELAANVDKILI